VGASSRDVTTATDGYAIPLDQAQSIGQQIIDGKSSATVHIGETGFLGVQVVPDGQPGASRTGVQVGGVVPGSSAEKAGVRAGDVITSVGGQAVTSSVDLHDVVSAHRPGDTVAVAWTDASGKRHTASIRLGTGPVG
jgi:S1-C subfamily serine protease